MRKKGDKKEQILPKDNFVHPITFSQLKFPKAIHVSGRTPGYGWKEPIDDTKHIVLENPGVHHHHPQLV
jgi:hypothetical protein